VLVTTIKLGHESQPLCVERPCKPLAAIVNSRDRPARAKILSYCDNCQVHICIRKGYWKQYHDEDGLKIRPEDRVEDEGEEED